MAPSDDARKDPHVSHAAREEQTRASQDSDGAGYLATPATPADPGQTNFTSLDPDATHYSAMPQDLPGPKQTDLPKPEGELPTVHELTDPQQPGSDTTRDYHPAAAQDLDATRYSAAPASPTDPEQTRYTPADTGATNYAATPRIDQSPNRPEAELPAIPGYDLLGVLGRGGMGVVYQARQKSLKRLVALKMIRAGAQAAPEDLARFRTEAEAVARLQHPNIVQIHEIGEHDGCPYFSLEFVGGGSLALKIAGKPLPAMEAAALTETLARAMYYSHQRGIIHRDLKPANVLLTEEGLPKIADFGLAKHLEEGAGQTHTGAVMGTASYMAPEQAEGRTRDIGPLTDVYALGAILYELLTGGPPFKAATHWETLAQVRTREPAPPSRLQPRIHRDLETICLKALAKEPARRYASALTLAQDLERFRAGEAILARRETVLRKAYRKLRRNVVAVSAVTLVLVALAVAGLVTAGYLRMSKVNALKGRVLAELEAVDGTPEQFEKVEGLLTELASSSPADAEAMQPRLHGSLAAKIERRLQQTARLQAEDSVQLDAEIDLLVSRAPDLGASLRQSHNARKRNWDTVFRLVPPFTDVAKYLPAGRFAIDQEKALVFTKEVSVLPDFRVPTLMPCPENARLTVELDDVAGSATEFGLLFDAYPEAEGHTSPSIFAPDGASVATGSPNGKVLLWDAKTGNVRQSWAAHQSGPSVVAYSPDGATLASGGTDGLVMFWDARTGASRGVLKGHSDRVLHVTYAPDGRHLASTSADGEIIVWDAVQQTLIKRGQGTSRKQGGTHGVSFDPGGNTLVFPSNTSAMLWNYATGEGSGFLVDAWKTVLAIAHAPNRQTFAVANECGNIALVDRQTREVRSYLFRWHDDAIHSVAYSPDNRWLATGHMDGTVLIWNLVASLAEHNSKCDQVGGAINAEFPKLHTGAVTSLAFSPDGNTLASWSQGGTLKLTQVGQRTLDKKNLMPSHEAACLIAVRPADAAQGATLATVQKAGGSLLVRIFRQGALQREEEIRVRTGRLHVVAAREGNDLLVRINDEPAIEFHDVWRAGRVIDRGVLALYCPGDIRLITFQAESRLVTPTNGSPLERGEQLYAQKKYEAALTYFQEQAHRAGGGDAGKPLRREAQCRSALCLTRLGRKRDAITKFEELIHDSGIGNDQWSLIALFELWLLRVQERQFKEAGLLFEEIDVGFSTKEAFTRISEMVPEELRDRILLEYLKEDRGERKIFFDPSLIPHFQYAVKVADLLQATAQQRWLARLHLLHAHRAVGEDDKAAALARTMLQQEDAPLQYQFLWMSRTYGDLQRALQLQYGSLYSAPDVFQSLEEAGLTAHLLERARLQAAAKQPGETAKLLDLLLKRSIVGMPYERYAEASVMQGFLYDDRGEHAAAREAWRRALFHNWLRQQPEKQQAMPAAPISLVAASLSDELTDSDAQALMSAFLPPGTASWYAKLAELSPLRPATLRQTFQSGRGRQFARRIAFGEADSWHEQVRWMHWCNLAEMLHQDALPGPLMTADEDVIWQVIRDGHDAYCAGKLSLSDLLWSYRAWKGNSFAWAVLQKSLAVRLQANGAYLLGHRYLHLDGKKPKDAVPLFQQAVKQAPPNSPVWRLAQAQLDLFQPKK